MKLKYVMVDDSCPILFGEYFKHSDFSNIGNKITSAGFCNVREVDGEMDVSVWGESVSLKIKSIPDDACFIKMMFNKS
jgi:hypothetical protein